MPCVYSAARDPSIVCILSQKKAFPASFTKFLDFWFSTNLARRCSIEQIRTAVSYSARYVLGDREEVSSPTNAVPIPSAGPRCWCCELRSRYSGVLFRDPLRSVKALLLSLCRITSLRGPRFRLSPTSSTLLTSSQPFDSLAASLLW